MSIDSEIKNLGIEAYLQAQQEKSFLRFLSCGSVDDGKSTLIGRLLHDTRQIYEDQLQSIQKNSPYSSSTKDPSEDASEDLDFALLVDGLEAEQEQGITIDIAYRYFSTDKRKFIIADAPGHEQYTRNMATAASNCEAAILLIDAKQGVKDQTRRHGFITSLFGIQHIIIAINKMDLVNYQEETFKQIKSEVEQIFNTLNPKIKTYFLPISALKGDNITQASTKTPWYEGPTILELLETIDITALDQNQDLRFPVQYVNRPHQNFRGYCGSITNGQLEIGQTIKVMPLGTQAKITEIITQDQSLEKAQAGDAITLTLTPEVDVSRGDWIVSADDNVTPSTYFSADIVWMSNQPMRAGQRYGFQITGKTMLGTIGSITHKIDINQLTKQAADTLLINDIAQVEIILDGPMMMDLYQNKPQTGGFIIIDHHSKQTVAAGMVRAIEQTEVAQFSYSAFELEFNALICKHFPHWGAKNLALSLETKDSDNL